MRKTIGLVVFGLVLAGGAGVASAQSGRYGMAGCGLGSILLGDKPGIMQIFAATTNGLFGTQTFGITTGTSNCVDSGGGIASAKAFIQSNREALAKDISRGGGETVDNLATLSGCANTGQVGGALQRNFGVIFPSAAVSDVQVSDAMVGVLRGEPSLSCDRLQ
jgi:hypothetical protein